jgi:hypothetical protein
MRAQPDIGAEVSGYAREERCVKSGRVGRAKPNLHATLAIVVELAGLLELLKA